VNATPQTQRQFIPALRFHFLTPLYDATLKYVMRERLYKEALCNIIPAQTPLGRAGKILDAGCGTGTLTAMMKRMHPLLEIHGVDIDDNVLKIARQKFESDSLNISLHKGSVLQLPFDDNSFNAVFSCLVIHHLTTENKQKALQEIFRILKPGGTLAVADFAPPHNFSMMMVTLATQYFEETYDNFHGRLLEFIPKAGFFNLTVDGSFWTPIGTVSIITSLKPTIN